MDSPWTDETRVRLAEVRAAYLPARRRWMRVRFSSLRCFFFAIRLRRFLMTEPTDLALSTSRDRRGLEILFVARPEIAGRTRDPTRPYERLANPRSAAD